MSLTRIWAIALNAFREVIRERILYLIGLFAFFMVAVALLLPQVAATTEKKILIDFGLAFITILSVIVTIFVGTGLVNKEIEKRTLLVLIPKPVRRVEFIIGKHLGLSAVVAVLLLSMTAIYLITLSLNKISYPIGSILVAIFYLFIELSLITSVAILFGVFTSSLLATLMTFAVYFVGHLSSDITKLAEIAKNPNLERLTDTLYLILPNLSWLDLKNQAVYGVLPDAIELLKSASFGIAYTILMLVIASNIFTRREF